MYETIIGDCLESLKKMPDNSVNCCITSPPYFGLRDYGLPPTNWPAVSFSPMPGLPKVKVPKWTGCLGLEPDPLMFIGHIVLVFREVRRVLKKDGTLWLNFGDSYAANNSGNNGYKDGRKNRAVRSAAGAPSSLKAKDLIGIPWRAAFALQADGWWLRQDIIWEKPNPMPESVKDRCTKAHEYIFLLTKSARYWYDAEAVKEPSVDPEGSVKRYASPFFVGDKHESGGYSASGPKHTGGMKEFNNTRNRRSVWTVATQSYKGAHFATFPPELIRPCVKAGCPKDGTVLDPFAGSGTTGRVCIEEGRNAILLELNPSYGKLIKKRIHGAQLPMF